MGVRRARRRRRSIKGLEVLATWAVYGPCAVTHGLLKECGNTVTALVETSREVKGMETVFDGGDENGKDVMEDKSMS